MITTVELINKKEVNEENKTIYLVPTEDGLEPHSLFFVDRKGDNLMYVMSGFFQINLNYSTVRIPKGSKRVKIKHIVLEEY